MIQKNYYKILGVDKSATTAEIRREFRKLALKHHPDQNRGDKIAEAHFKKIGEAFEVLKDDLKRRAYDAGTYDPEQPSSYDRQPMDPAAAAAAGANARRFQEVLREFPDDADFEPQVRSYHDPARINENSHQAFRETIIHGLAADTRAEAEKRFGRGQYQQEYFVQGCTLTPDQMTDCLSLWDRQTATLLRNKNDLLATQAELKVELETLAAFMQGAPGMRQAGTARAEQDAINDLGHPIQTFLEAVAYGLQGYDTRPLCHLANIKEAPRTNAQVFMKEEGKLLALQADAPHVERLATRWQDFQIKIETALPSSSANMRIDLIGRLKAIAFGDNLTPAVAAEAIDVMRYIPQAYFRDEARNGARRQLLREACKDFRDLGPQIAQLGTDAAKIAVLSGSPEKFTSSLHRQKRKFGEASEAYEREEIKKTSQLRQQLNTARATYLENIGQKSSAPLGNILTPDEAQLLRMVEAGAEPLDAKISIELLQAAASDSESLQARLGNGATRRLKQGSHDTDPDRTVRDFKTRNLHPLLEAAQMRTISDPKSYTEVERWIAKAEAALAVAHRLEALAPAFGAVSPTQQKHRRRPAMQA